MFIEKNSIAIFFVTATNGCKAQGSLRGMSSAHSNFFCTTCLYMVHN